MGSFIITQISAACWGMIQDSLQPLHKKILTQKT